MGCCGDCSRLLLVVINLVFSLVGIALLVVGCLVRFSSDFLDTYLQTAYNAFQKALEEAAGNSNINISDLDIGDLAGDASLAFIVIGAFFFVAGIFGCIGAMCEVKFLLITYTIMLMTVFTVEVVFIVLLFTIKSEIDGWILDPLITKMEKSYTGTSGTDAFTLSMNFVMHEFKCCGIDSYKEFQNTTKWNRTNPNQEVPYICCKQPNDTSCTLQPMLNNSYINQGCYEAINEWLTDKSSVLVGTCTGVAGIQLLLIIFSFIICCGKRKDDDDTNSYSDEIAIHPYRESQEAMTHQNYNYNGPYDSKSHAGQYNDRVYPEPYRGRHDKYTNPPPGYGSRDPYRR